MKFELSTEQYKCIYEYLATYLIIPTQRQLGIQSHRAYLKAVARDRN